MKKHPWDPSLANLKDRSLREMPEPTMAIHDAFPIEVAQVDGHPSLSSVAQHMMTHEREFFHLEMQCLKMHIHLRVSIERV